MAYFFTGQSPEPDVSNITCRCCRYFGKGCRCIDHRYVHFTRSCFSSDIFTGHHTICKMFSPHRQLVPAIAYEWDILGGFTGWHPLYLKQWRYGKLDKVAGLIRAKTIEGRHPTDDVYVVPFEDFLNCKRFSNETNRDALKEI